MQVIGKGGFAEVWEAEHNGDRVALKFISCDNTSTTVREIRSLSAIQKLDHPGLIRMDCVSSIPGYIVVSMELAEGSLFDLLDVFQEEYQSPVELKPLLDYMTQVAKVIDFLNTRQHTFEGRKVGFQHCDIKPSNLLLFGDSIKLADFGLSTPTYAPMNPVLRMGTVDFAAPEIHRGILSDKSDQYSFAVTYYYLRTGKFPFPQPVTNKFVRSYAYNRPAPDLTHVPPQEDAILLRALDLAPERRWPSCLDMIKKIKEVHGSGASSTTTRSSSPGMASSSGLKTSSGMNSKAGIATVS
jgi:serine/threonine protein kinase